MQSLIINRLDQILKYLNPLLEFSNCHMVDYFIENNFQKYIPIEIQNEITYLGQENILKYLLNKNYCPETLDKFLNETKNHTLEYLPDVCMNLQELQLKLIDLGCENLSGLRLDIFMSSKKSHEVEIMSEICTAVSEIAKNDIIVDIGDGKGYLSSALTLHSSLKVLGIDSSDINTKSATKRMSKFQKYYKNDYNKKSCNDFYKRVTKFVTDNTDLVNIVREFFPVRNFTLVGLHTCGNLAPNCLKIFINNPNVTAICNVGCCYHLLEEEIFENGQNVGFPLSNYLKGKQFKIGRNARMLAAQSIDRIIGYKELPSKILFYRALLQIILSKYHPNLLAKHVGRCQKKDPTFLEYVHKCFLKFGENLIVSNDEILRLYENYLPEEKNLQIFYLIRAHLAPVIESVILLDRLLFLAEHDLVNIFLVKMFNPVISPRCYGIVAFKNDL